MLTSKSESQNPTVPGLTGLFSSPGEPRSVPSWKDPTMLGIAIAIVLGLIGIALAVMALLMSPSKSVGLQGPPGAPGPAGVQGAQGTSGLAGPAGTRGPTGLTGSQGAPGKQGVAGPAGALGAPGKQGAAGAPGAPGAIANSNVVTAPPVESPLNPPVGTTVTTTTVCPAGTVLLSGGAQLSATGGAIRNVTLRSSYPLDNHTWRAVGLVTEPLGIGGTMKITPFVVCGMP